jgi:hypothetical protein
VSMQSCQYVFGLVSSSMLTSQYHKLRHVPFDSRHVPECSSRPNGICVCHLTFLLFTPSLKPSCRKVRTHARGCLHDCPPYNPVVTRVVRLSTAVGKVKGGFRRELRAYTSKDFQRQFAKHQIQETQRPNRICQGREINKGNGASKERQDDKEDVDRCTSGHLNGLIAHHAFPGAALQLTLRPSITFSHSPAGCIARAAHLHGPLSETAFSPHRKLCHNLTRRTMKMQQGVPPDSATRDRSPN